MRIRAIRPFWVGGSPVLLRQVLEVADSIGRTYIANGSAMDLDVPRKPRPRKKAQDK